MTKEFELKPVVREILQGKTPPKSLTCEQLLKVVRFLDIWYRREAKHSESHGDEVLHYILRQLYEQVTEAEQSRVTIKTLAEINKGLSRENDHLSKLCMFLLESWYAQAQVVDAMHGALRADAKLERLREDLSGSGGQSV